jgi:hypothetical protein
MSIVLLVFPANETERLDSMERIAHCQAETVMWALPPFLFAMTGKEDHPVPALSPTP